MSKVVALSTNQTTSIINNNDDALISLNLKDVIYKAKSGHLVNQKVLTSSVGIP